MLCKLSTNDQNQFDLGIENIELTAAKGNDLGRHWHLTVESLLVAHDIAIAP